MNEHDATEIAYKNGYKQGKADATREILTLVCDAYQTTHYDSEFEESEDTK